MDEILSRLSKIEQEEQVRIFYACESGSRAWGFPSADSDYDVRFLYLRPRDWYLSIDVDEKRDVIECPIVDDFDINGWDLRKALKLLRKSNPPLLEWLNSPIIYKETSTIAERLRAIIPDFYSPLSSIYHYLHIAKRNYRMYLKGDMVRIKKYFYVLRPLLAVSWIEQESEVVPMEFGVLVDRCIHSRELKSAIENLVELKKKGQEIDRGPRIDIISEFIERELQRLESAAYTQKRDTPRTEPLNELFRSALLEIG
jgi:predicted nucleotidyltransferase